MLAVVNSKGQKIQNTKNSHLIRYNYARVVLPHNFSFSMKEKWGIINKCRQPLYEVLIIIFCILLNNVHFKGVFFLPSYIVWKSAETMMRNYGPVFEEQPHNILFPERSTEEQILLVCQARASPPANYRWCHFQQLLCLMESIIAKSEGTFCVKWHFIFA